MSHLIASSLKYILSLGNLYSRFIKSSFETINRVLFYRDNALNNLSYYLNISTSPKYDPYLNTLMK